MLWQSRFFPVVNSKDTAAIGDVTPSTKYQVARKVLVAVPVQADFELITLYESGNHGRRTGREGRSEPKLGLRQWIRSLAEDRGGTHHPGSLQEPVGNDSPKSRSDCCSVIPMDRVPVASSGGVTNEISPTG
jgi:hypothetical protein